MLMRDVLHAVRQTCRRPGLPLVIVLSLAFAMGVSTSLFSVVNAVWLTPWSVPDSAGLRVIHPRVSEGEWRFWAEHGRAFSNVAARQALVPARYGDQVLRLGLVSENYFHVLGIPMLMGRAFAEADAAVNSVVVGHDFWQTRLGGDTRIIGQPITLEPVDRNLKSVTLTVVGVVALGFDGPDLVRTQLWLPLAALRQFQSTATGSGPSTERALQVAAFGRLAPGVSNTEAAAELSALSRRFRRQETLAIEPISVLGTARYEQGALPAQTRVMWGTLLVGIILITLIACASVANLLLASGHARRGEIALRLAFGATRGHVIRQLLVESSLLCLIAAALGLAVASWLPEMLYRQMDQHAMPSLADSFQLAFPIDRRVFLFGLGMSAIACAAFGLVPALRCSRSVSVSEVVKESHHISGRALMPSLISCQTTVSVMALTIAGLLLRSGSVTEARTIRHSVAELSVVRLDTLRQLDGPRRQLLVAAAAERLESVVGRDQVAGIVGQMQTGISQALRVTPNYFRVAQISWLAGRTFAPSDSPEQVVVVNEAFARRFPLNEERIGRILTSDDARASNGTLAGRQVIGIVSDWQVATPTAYLPAAIRDLTHLLVRGFQDYVVREAPRIMATLQPSTRVEVLSGSAWMASAIGPSFFVSIVIMSFGGAALLLGAIGLYSFLEFSVQQRTREIGIRRALGAQLRHVIYSVVQPTARPLLRSLFLGCVGGGGAAIFIQQAQLPADINPLDLASYAGVAATVLLTFVLASLGPACRATRSEPDKVLRRD